MSENSFYTFLPDGVSFMSQQAARVKTVYVPLCGTGAAHIKSAITPLLSGDIKVDKFHYLTKPASREDLRFPLRNFFLFCGQSDPISLYQEDFPEEVSIEVGPLWHKHTRLSKKYGLELSTINFIPVSGENVELMQIIVKNVGDKEFIGTPTFAVPLFGRSLSNKHDHEHVTALLNRVYQQKEGIMMHATMVFNEEGHKEGDGVYFVFGAETQGEPVLGSFPTVDSFYGDGGSLHRPQAVFENHKPVYLDEKSRHGKEVVGALRFKDVVLRPKQSHAYVLLVGMADDAPAALDTYHRFNTKEKFDQALQANKEYWLQKISSISFVGADAHFDSWMRWVVLQPVLRRIFGCSFLPDHDYGKGGRGWRDIWQDLLSLVLIEPHLVREDLINNCAGIRIDGSNATIIGTKPGEFMADRNAITRVWMDHGAWPFLTCQLYIDQTGDFDILLEKQPYFRDFQLSRTLDKDIGWLSHYGNKLLDKKGHVYEGSILEHLLVQHLVQFYNVGEHNIIRLESADWNDGLDMAFAKGESVAFTSLYGGNLLKVADLLEDMSQHKKISHLSLARELLILLDTLSEKVNYDDPKAKYKHLQEKYYHAVQPSVSGETVIVAIKDVVSDLRLKGHWIFAHVRRQEKIQVTIGPKIYEWFNGYYDNQAKRVEGLHHGRVRMTLTGGVFAIMSGMATKKDIENIMEAVTYFLRDKEHGGYRLNTDFGLPHYLDLGRAFGFAYGTKENGSFFSHMNVMLAAGLYQRGFARLGHEVLQSIYRMSTNGRCARIYPGIPEYFDSEGRGMYHYLTGSASWFVWTLLTQVFGVRGLRGDLILHPQLVAEEFNKEGFARLECQFAARRLQVTYCNPQKLDVGHYTIKEVTIDGKPITFKPLAFNKVLIPRSAIHEDVAIKVILSEAKNLNESVLMGLKILRPVGAQDDV